MQRKAAKVGFDWPDVHGAAPKIVEETAELFEAVAAGDQQAVASEIGDLLFAVVNVARHLGVEPEAALRAAGRRFRARFEGVEALAARHGADLRSCTLEQLDAWWDEVKRGGA